VKQADLIWMNGEFVAWEDAKVHVLTHGLHYGTGVFEGIRCYDTEALGPAVFRHREHYERLSKSAELYYCPMPYDVEALRKVTHELINRNGMRSCYIRPIVYRGYGQMGLNPLEAPVDVSIAVWEWGHYLGDTKETGVRAKVSSWRRISSDALIPAAKASGQYLNSILAKIESHKAGYEEAILLDDKGHVCEGSGENIFVVIDGQIVTPPMTASILGGINRRSAIQIARDLGFEVVERDIARAELYMADEVYLTGTAAELVPVREVDDHKIGTGARGEVTAAVQQAFDDALYGRDKRYHEWLDPVPAVDRVG
jgi:branched-chain amino acid aminotransferase